MTKSDDQKTDRGTKILILNTISSSN